MRLIATYDVFESFELILDKSLGTRLIATYDVFE